MGQYFKAVNIETMKWIQSNCFSKLTETSWVGNDFMQAVMKALSPDGLWFQSRVVWAGDYYNEDDEIDYYDLVKECDQIKYKSIEGDSSAYARIKKWQQGCILVNFDKQEYVRYDTLPPSSDGWTINPLPILVALGNDRGGGDYRDGNPDYDKVGIWAGDRIGILQEIPYAYWELKVGFKD